MADVASSTQRSIFDSSTPKLSLTKTDDIMSSDFMKRQDMHIKKQQKLLEKTWQMYHRNDVVRFSFGKQPNHDSDKAASKEQINKDKTAWSLHHDGSDHAEKLVEDVCLDNVSVSKAYGTQNRQSIGHIGSHGNGSLLSAIPAKADISSRSVLDEISKKPRKLANINVNLERLQLAKEIADQAIKSKRIFTIAGPYPFVRDSLRRRGWVEKFYRIEEGSGYVSDGVTKAPSLPRKKKGHGTAASDDDYADTDDGDDAGDGDDEVLEDEDAVKPWEEDNGIYGIMSRMTRNNTPTFIWSMKKDSIDFRFLKKEQMVNHYSKNGAFTTKVGLCTNLRQARWFQDVDHDKFYPRCYRLSHEEEKSAFIDDYHLTAAMGIVRWVIARYREPSGSDDEESSSTQRSKQGGGAARHLPMALLDQALMQCNHWLAFKNNEDLEDVTLNEMLDLNWDDFLQQYYDLCHNGWIIQQAKERLAECEALAGKLREYWPQFDLDGTRNVWIVKPGAKSRGRGIACYNKLNDMLKLVDSVVRKDSKYVVQKYMERPLLIHQTKFDIRQWFLVTDWNPLTVWWYRECYLRFCKRKFDLSDFNEAIHLSNNSIQKHYDVDPERSKEIPDDSMWSSTMFEDYLRSRGHGQIFAEYCQPKMQEAVICALLTTQDIVEFRKSSFELYGADFMLTEDLKPWLIEINSSPSMATSTRVTAELVPQVLDDMMKVLLDRKQDRECDVGKFELIYKPSAVTVPQYLGINLAVDGAAMKSDGRAARRAAPAAEPIPHLTLTHGDLLEEDADEDSQYEDRQSPLEVKGKKKPHATKPSRRRAGGGRPDGGAADSAAAAPTLSRRKAKQQQQQYTRGPLDARSEGGAGSAPFDNRDPASPAAAAGGGLPRVFEDASLVSTRKTKRKKKPAAAGGAPPGGGMANHHPWT